MDNFILTETISDVVKAVHTAFPLVDRDEIRQELWLWVLENSDQVEDWSEINAEDRSDLLSALRAHGAKYARNEQKRRAELGVDRDTGERF